MLVEILPRVTMAGVANRYVSTIIESNKLG